MNKLNRKSFLGSMLALIAAPFGLNAKQVSKPYGYNSEEPLVLPLDPNKNYHLIHHGLGRVFPYVRVVDDEGDIVAARIRVTTQWVEITLNSKGHHLTAYLR